MLESSPAVCLMDSKLPAIKLKWLVVFHIVCYWQKVNSRLLQRVHWHLRLFVIPDELSDLLLPKPIAYACGRDLPAYNP